VKLPTAQDWQRGFISGRAAGFQEAAATARHKARCLKGDDGWLFDELAMVFELMARIADEELKKLGSKE
jgi:hypothetical protein